MIYLGARFGCGIGDAPITGPIVLTFDEFEPPTASLYQPDGQLPNELDYIDFTDLLTDNELPSGEFAGPKMVYWHNPTEEHLNLLSIPYGLNSAPVITSQPGTMAAEDQMYTYLVTAEDEDVDPIEFGLAEGPEEMSVNPTTGLLAWRPAQGDAGDFPVTVMAADGRDSGVSEQSYVVVPAGSRKFFSDRV